MSSVYKVGATLAEAAAVANFRLSFGNQVPDRAEIPLNLDHDAAVPAAFGSVGSVVSLFRDGTRIFTGTRTNPKRRFASGDSSVAVRLEGPWAYLERTFWKWTGHYQNNASTYDNQSVTISGVTMASAITSLLSGYTGTFLNIGTISLPTFLLPSVQLQNFTVAAGIRAILRYCPDAVVAFDYSPSVPTLNIFNSTASEMAGFATYGGRPAETADMEWEDRHDMQLARVQLLFWRPYSRRSRYWLSTATTRPTEESSSSKWLEGVADTGAASGNFMTQMIQMDGQRREEYLRFDIALMPVRWSTVLQQRGSPFPLWPWLINFLSAEALSFYHLWLFNGSEYGSAYQVQKASAMSSKCTLDYASNPSAWFLCDWGGAPVPPEELWSTSGFDGFEVARLDLVLQFRQPIPNSSLGFDTQVSVTIAKPMQGGTFVARTINADDAGLASVPTGIASRLLSDNATLRADGTVKLEAEEPVIPGVFERRITTPSGTSGLIQSIDIDVAQGQTSIKFGPPAQLGPDDFRNILNAQG